MVTILALCCVLTIFALVFAGWAHIRLVTLKEDTDLKMQRLHYRIDTISVWTKPLSKTEDEELESRLTMINLDAEGGFQMEVNRERAVDQNRT